MTKTIPKIHFIEPFQVTRLIPFSIRVAAPCIACILFAGFSVHQIVAEESGPANEIAGQSNRWTRFGNESNASSRETQSESVKASPKRLVEAREVKAKENQPTSPRRLPIPDQVAATQPTEVQPSEPFQKTVPVPRKIQPSGSKPDRSSTSNWTGSDWSQELTKQAAELPSSAEPIAIEQKVAQDEIPESNPITDSQAAAGQSSPNMDSSSVEDAISEKITAKLIEMLARKMVEEQVQNLAPNHPTASVKRTPTASPHPASPHPDGLYELGTATLSISKPASAGDSKEVADRKITDGNVTHGEVVTNIAAMPRVNPFTQPPGTVQVPHRVEPLKSHDGPADSGSDAERHYSTLEPYDPSNDQFSRMPPLEEPVRILETRSDTGDERSSRLSEFYPNADSVNCSPRHRSTTPQPSKVGQSAPEPHLSDQHLSGQHFHQLAADRTQQAMDCLQRGMPLSARKHAENALVQLAKANDAARGDTAASRSLVASLTAIREARDFPGRFGILDRDAMKRLIESHQTPVAKDYVAKDYVAKDQNALQVSPQDAVSSYHQFARTLMMNAVAKAPTASTALRILAETEPVVSRDRSEVVSQSKSCYLLAATDCNPNDARSQVALGTTLASLGIFGPAKAALVQGAQGDMTGQALQQLASVHRKAGDVELANRCQRQSEQIAATELSKAVVYNLSPEQFAKVSPQLIESGAGSPTGNGLPASDVPSESSGPISTIGRIPSAFQSFLR